MIPVLRIRLPLWLAVLALLPCPAIARRDSHTGRVRVTSIRYHGWQHCYRMSNGAIDAVVVPAIGGRIMEYSLHGVNPFFENRAEYGKVYPITPVWHNYGGFKDWNAPQSRWNWPPDPYLDFGAATIEILNPTTPSPTLRITGSPSLASSLLVVREITMDAPSGDLTVRQRLYNIGGQPQEWGVWGITQVRWPCVVAVPLNAHSSFPVGWEALSDGHEGEAQQWHPHHGMLVIRPDGKVGKIGADATAGWMAYFNGRIAYVRRFPSLQSDAVYPDHGANAEVYTNGRDLPYLEMEILSPLFNLPAGGYGELTETWRVRELRRPVRSDEEVDAAVNEIGLTH